VILPFESHMLNNRGFQMVAMLEEIPMSKHKKGPVGDRAFLRFLVK